MADYKTSEFSDLKSFVEYCEKIGSTEVKILNDSKSCNISFIANSGSSTAAIITIPYSKIVEFFPEETKEMFRRWCYNTQAALIRKVNA